MTEPTKIDLELNTTELEADLEKVDKQVDRLEEKATKTINFVKDKSSETYSQVLGMLQTAWSTTEAVVSAAGGAISTEFAGMIQMGLSALMMLKPLLVTRALATQDYVSLALGMASFVETMVALAAAKTQEKELERNLRVSMSLLNGVSAMINSMRFLY